MKVIIILDDDIDICESVKYQVKSKFGEEFIYEMAQSGEEALELIDEFQQEGIDILITISDWLMPGMRGDEFFIRLHKILPNSLKIMLTGQASQEAIDRAYKQANLYKVLYKPWNEQDLIDTIQKGLEDQEE